MKWASFILTCLASVTVSCATAHRPPDVDSFAMVMTQAPFIDCSVPGCATKVSVGTGSGVVFWSDDSGTWILTAGHVCAAAQRPLGEMAVFSGMGNLHLVEKWVMSSDPDLCVILTTGKWGVPVQFSTHDPKRGDRIWSQAAPRGIFMAGAPLLFEGTWSGVSGAGDAIVTMPCAPGASGASLVDERGEVVAVVHSTAINFGEIAIATRREEVIRFVAEARSKIMGWQPPADDTADPPAGKLPL